MRKRRLTKSKIAMTDELLDLLCQLVPPYEIARRMRALAARPNCEPDVREYLTRALADYDAEQLTQPSAPD